MGQCIDLERDEDMPAIEQLLDAAFGPEREARTAYRFRKNIGPVRELGFVMRGDMSASAPLLGSVRFWPLILRPDMGESPRAALLLGPLAVQPELRGAGIGIALLRHGLATVRERGWGPVFLIGDLPYYSRAGFRSVLPSQCTMPGPVEPDRVLYWDADFDNKLPGRFALEPLGG